MRSTACSTWGSRSRMGLQPLGPSLDGDADCGRQAGVDFCGDESGTAMPQTNSEMEKGLRRA